MQKIIKKQDGISLVALIITIIVMVILAGIIITAAVADGGIIDRAQVAMQESEKSDIQEIIIGSYVYKVTASTNTVAVLDLGKTGIAIFENLTANGFKVEGEPTTDENGNQTTRVLYDDVNEELSVEVEGKYGTYEGTVKKEGLDGELKTIEPTSPVENDFEIEVGRYNYGNAVRLYINPIIPNDWAPSYTKKEAVNMIASILKEQGIIVWDKEFETVSEFAIDLYNFANDLEDSPFDLDPTDISTTDELKQKLSPYFDNQIPTDSQIEQFVLTYFFEVPYTSMEEFAQSIYEYEATSRKLKVNGVEIEEDNSWGTNSAQYLVEKNGTYEIQLELDGKIATKTLEIDDIQYFVMTINKKDNKYYSVPCRDESNPNNTYTRTAVQSAIIEIKLQVPSYWYNPNALEEAKTKSITINDQDVTEQVDWGTNKLNYLAEKNGTYEIKVQVDEYIKTEKIEITDLYEYLNTYVKYDSNQDGNLEDEIMYRVLYSEGELGEGMGAQMISEDVIEGVVVELGAGDKNVNEEELKEINGNQDLNFERALYSYNNSVNTLNNKCKEIIKEIKGITNGVRSMGSNPINPYENLNEVDEFKREDIKGYIEGNKTWFDRYDGIAKKGTEDNLEYQRLMRLDIAKASKDYWDAARMVKNINNYNGNFGFCVRYGAANGGWSDWNSELLNCYEGRCTT